jgi:acyl carrier protein
MFEEELILLLNEEFDIEITDAETWDLMKSFSVRDIVVLVNKKVEAKLHAAI